MGTLTTNYSFQKPTPGGDPDTWGDDYAGGDPLVDPSPGLNGNWEKTDQLIKALADRIDDLENNVIPSLYIPVGGLYISPADTDPATTLGYGTWEAYAEGRALVGVGTSNTADAKVWASEQEDGLESHVLTEAELAAHLHSVDPPSTNTSSDTHNHTMAFNRRTDIERFGSSTTNAFDAGSGYNDSTNNDTHSHSVNIPAFDSAAAGGDAAHNNIQPSIGVHIWRRLT